MTHSLEKPFQNLVADNDYRRPPYVSPETYAEKHPLSPKEYLSHHEATVSRFRVLMSSYTDSGELPYAGVHARVRLEGEGWEEARIYGYSGPEGDDPRVVRMATRIPAEATHFTVFFTGEFGEPVSDQDYGLTQEQLEAVRNGEAKAIADLDRQLYDAACVLEILETAAQNPELNPDMVKRLERLQAAGVSLSGVLDPTVRDEILRQAAEG